MSDWVDQHQGFTQGVLLVLMLPAVLGYWLVEQTVEILRRARLTLPGVGGRGTLPGAAAAASESIWGAERARRKIGFAYEQE